jgi:hypothetical protein
MDLLTSITGSRVRADVLAALFGGVARVWMPNELGRVARHPRQVVNRELKRLAATGLIRARLADGRRHYEADREGPISRELFRLVRQTRGRIPRIRHALVALRSPTLAWVVGPSQDRRIGPWRRKLELIVVTGAPRSLVRVQLADLIDKTTELSCMSIREWVTRLEKGDVLLRRARRGHKLWVLGDWETLTSRERAVIESDRLLRDTVANWREELSDEWDEDWDPFAPVPGPAA